jgi:ubiquinone/menaquinone biosynthesis C-methylase UbiE/uncharacterized protein YbaR (Trm112 family)
MNRDLVSLLADPNDGSALELHSFEGDKDTVREGILAQPQTGRWYPIREGIPSLFADDLRVGGLGEEDRSFAARHEAAMREAGFGSSADAAEESGKASGDFARIESERKARDEQAEDYDRMFSLKFYERIETPVYRRALVQDITTDRSLPLLEAGCGTGRFTGLFAELGSMVVAVDMSRDSIVRNRVRWAGKTASPVHYIHADLTHLPLQSDLFGAVAHCGVYEHIPSRSMREQFLEHASRALKPSGALLLSAYRYGGITKLFGKEGEHAGGIPFTRFTEDELRDEVGAYFQIEKFRANLGIYMSMVVARPKA